MTYPNQGANISLESIAHGLVNRVRKNLSIICTYGETEMNGTRKKLMEENYCISCYEAIGDSELVEIPTPSYESDKFVHQDCFLTKLEELASDATRE